MAQRNKIDSNETEFSMALEVVGTPGVLPGTAGADAIWIGLEPNEYDDFGGENELLARRPINSSRQRKKGAIVDLDASGGFNQDFTNENSETLVSGFMYARARAKPSAAVTAVTATGYTVADETVFVVGMIVMATGFSNAATACARVSSSSVRSAVAFPASSIAFLSASNSAFMALVCVTTSGVVET